MLCSACRKDIPYSTLYYACSVSTCNRAATRLVFCSVGCWDSHVATLRHRDAWAEEARAYNELVSAWTSIEQSSAEAGILGSQAQLDI